MTDNGDFFARMELLQRNLNKRLNVSSPSSTSASPVRGERASPKFSPVSALASPRQRSLSRAASKVRIAEREPSNEGSSRSPSKRQSLSRSPSRQSLSRSPSKTRAEDFEAEQRSASKMSRSGSQMWAEEFEAEQRGPSKLSRAASKLSRAPSKMLGEERAPSKLSRTASKLRLEELEADQRSASKMSRSPSKAESRAASKLSRSPSRSPSKMAFEDFQSESRSASKMSRSPSRSPSNINNVQAEARASSKFDPDDVQLGQRAESKTQRRSSFSIAAAERRAAFSERRSSFSERRNSFAEALRSSSKIMSNVSFGSRADEGMQNVNVPEKIMELERRVAERRLDSKGPLASKQASKQAPSRLEVSAADGLALAEWRRDGASLVDSRLRSYEPSRGGSYSRRPSIDSLATWDAMEMRAASMKSSWVPLSSWGEGGAESDDESRTMTAMRLQDVQIRAVENETIFRAGTSYLFRRTMHDLDDDVADLLACA